MKSVVAFFRAFKPHGFGIFGSFLPFWLLLGYFRPFVVPFEKKEVGVEDFLMEPRSRFSLLNRISILRRLIQRVVSLLVFKSHHCFCGVKWNSAFFECQYWIIEDWMKIGKCLQWKEMVRWIVRSLNLSIKRKVLSIWYESISFLFLSPKMALKVAWWKKLWV